MKTDEQLERILAMLGENNKGIAELKTAMQEMTSAKEEFDAWKPDVEQRVSDLQHVVTQLGDRVEQLVAVATAPSSGSEQPVTPTGTLPPTSTTAHLVVPSKEATSGPKGHRVEEHHRGSGFGVVYTSPDPPPVTGAKNHHQFPFNSSDTMHRDRSWQSMLNHAIPPINFPQFEGANPKLWIHRCEAFFDLYNVPKFMWVNLATMNFLGSASFWLHSLQTNLKSLT